METHELRKREREARAARWDPLIPKIGKPPTLREVSQCGYENYFDGCDDALWRDHALAAIRQRSIVRIDAITSETHAVRLPMDEHLDNWRCFLGASLDDALARTVAWLYA